MKILEIKNLIVAAGEKVILDNISFDISKGESVVIMGPNGSGKSTLANVLMGHPHYSVLSGEIIFKEKNIIDLKPEERAAMGMFLTFQEPREISGLELFPFLFDSSKSLLQAKKKELESVFAFKNRLDAELQNLKVVDDWSNRHLNQDFSGGEKKKSELLQLALTDPDLAIFDEIDSGLDVDALEVAGQAIKRFKDNNKTLLIVTHYQRVLKYVQPDKVIVMAKGKIVANGEAGLASRLEKEGFNSFN